MSKKKYFAIFLVLVTLFTFFPTVEMDASAELRRQLQELERQRTEARAQVRESQTLLEGVRAEIAELLEIIQGYTQRIMDAYADLEEIEIVLLQTELRTTYAEMELVEARAYRDKQDEIFRTRLRAMHEQGPAGHLQVLFQATSFSDFLVRLEHVRAVSQFDREILETMQEAEDRVANTVDELVRLHTSFERLQDERQLAIIALEEAHDANTAMLTRMYADEEQALLMYELQSYEEQAVNELFGIVSVRLRAAETEEARQRREEELRQQREAQNARLANLNEFDGVFQWPVPTSSHISSYFGWRTIFGRREHHYGIDIARTPVGTRIVAAADGYVRFAGWNSGFGNYIIIDHCSVYSTLYAHNSLNRVRAGQRVTRGQHIADVGSTGRSTGPHLHFEIRRNGVRVNPMQYFR